MDITEKAFETHIVDHLCQVHGYRLRISKQQNNVKDSHYQKSQYLDWEILLEFITATQPDTWKTLEKQHGTATVGDKFLQRLTREIERRGTLDVLRRGIKDYGCYFQLAYFKPVSTLNPEHQLLYSKNILSVVRQCYYSAVETKDALDKDPEKAALSEIIAEINQRFGTNFTEADRVFFAELKNRLADNESLQASAKANTREKLNCFMMLYSMLSFRL